MAFGTSFASPCGRSSVASLRNLHGGERVFMRKTPHQQSVSALACVAESAVRCKVFLSEIHSFNIRAANASNACLTVSKGTL